MKLIEHLPPRLQMVAEYRALCAAVEEELTALRAGVESVRRNLVISTAEEEGLSRFEGQLGLSGGGSFSDRRAALLARAIERPYSVQTLENRLRIMVGEHGYRIQFDGRTLKVLISLEAKGAYRAVCETLRAIVPSNIPITVEVKLTTHRELVGFTHKTLSEYTYEEIRNEVATNG